MFFNKQPNAKKTRMIVKEKIDLFFLTHLITFNLFSYS